MDYGYTEDPEIVHALLTYGHKAFVLWSVLVDVLYQRGGVLTLKSYVINELEDRAKLTNHEVTTLLDALVKVELINYDKSNEKVTITRVTKELNLRSAFSEVGRKNALKRWQSGQDPKSDGNPNGNPKPTHEGGQSQPIKMGTHKGALMHSKDSNLKGSLKKGSLVETGRPLGSPVSESDKAKWEAAPSSFDLFEAEYPQVLSDKGKGKAWTLWARLHPDERQTAYELLDKFVEQFEVCPAEEYLEGKYWLNIQTE